MPVFQPGHFVPRRSINMSVPQELPAMISGSTKVSKSFQSHERKAS